METCLQGIDEDRVELGIAAHACNHSSWEAEAGDGKFLTSLGYIGPSNNYNKQIKSFYPPPPAPSPPHPPPLTKNNFYTAGVIR